MTKIKFLTAAAALTLLFTACKKKDKESDNYKAAIVGKWNYVETVVSTNGQSQPAETETYTHGEYERFTASDTVYYGSSTTTVDRDYLFYKLDGSTLTYAEDKAFTQGLEICHIETLNNSELRLSNEVEVTPGTKVTHTVRMKK